MTGTQSGNSSNGDRLQSLKGKSLLSAIERNSLLPITRTADHSKRVKQPGESPLLQLGASSKPQTEEALKKASAWLSIYPNALIPRTEDPKDDPALVMLRELVELGFLQGWGIEGIYITPINKSGGINDNGDPDCESTDGNFDPVSLEIDERLVSTEHKDLLEGGDIDENQRFDSNDYTKLAKATQTKKEGKELCLIGNLIPLHTGKGLDFRLALHGLEEYRTLYMMVAILDKKDWEDERLLPKAEVSGALNVENMNIPVARLELNQARKLAEKYPSFPGLIKSCDAALEADKYSGWSVTDVIKGWDGRDRRWVYMHFFKDSQPVLNLDHPDCQAVRLVNGQILNEIWRGATGIRIDAIPFGVERSEGRDPQAEDSYTPSSVRKANQHASLIRQLGGFSFQELMSPLETVRKFTEYGADLTYDFFTRAPYLHALLTGDATFLRLSFQLLLENKIQPKKLIHDLQNHDELTYQYPELKQVQRTRFFDIDGQRKKGGKFYREILEEMKRKIEEGKGRDGHKIQLYRSENDGIPTTLAWLVAVGLGILDPYKADKAQIEWIKKGHLLAVRINAMQPGVFSLSMWDLLGALPVGKSEVSGLIGEEDYRWMNRGGISPLESIGDMSRRSAVGLPAAQCLYGSLTDQNQEDNSFAKQLGKILRAREKYGLAFMDLCEPMYEPDNKSVCVLVLNNSGDRFVITAMNFAHPKKLVGGQETPDTENGKEEEQPAGDEESSGVENGTTEEEIDIYDIISRHSRRTDHWWIIENLQEGNAECKWRIDDKGVDSKSGELSTSGTRFYPKRDRLLTLTLPSLDGITLLIKPADPTETEQ